MARLLGVSPSTVNRALKDAREGETRYLVERFECTDRVSDENRAEATALLGSGDVDEYLRREGTVDGVPVFREFHPVAATGDTYASQLASFSVPVARQVLAN